MEENNVPDMRPTFDEIRKVDDNGKEYWNSRDLCNAMGYSAYWKFQNVIDKAINVAGSKGMTIDEHFNHAVDMFKVGNGAFRKVETFHLSRMACMIIAENADTRKPLVKLAREYFSQSVSTTEIVQNSLESNILLYKTAQGELQREATCRKIQQVQLEGERDVERAPLFYNLDVIIVVGYRVNSYQATQFRIWATSVLKEFVIKGYVLDDERLKQGKHFGKDYFDDLLERIREIRTSERRYYQKITDIYAECSADYDAKAESTKLFYKMVQNMMHLAVTNHTAAEIVYERADAEMPHMGLTTWKKAPNGRVQKSDTIVAKNYLSEDELSQLNTITTSFLDLAESRARRHIITTMDDWKQRLQQFLATMDYDAKSSAGKVSQEEARDKAYSEYEKFKVIQDRSYISDFDRFNNGNDDDTPLLPFDIDPKEE